MVTLTKEFYRVDEFARMFELSERTAYRRIEEGSVKSVRIGRTVRIPVDEIRRLLGQQKKR